MWYSYGFSCYCFFFLSSYPSLWFSFCLFIIFSIYLFAKPIYLSCSVSCALCERAQKNTPKSCSFQFGFCLIMTNVVLFSFNLLTFRGHIVHRYQDEIPKQTSKYCRVSVFFYCLKAVKGTYFPIIILIFVWLFHLSAFIVICCCLYVFGKGMKSNAVAHKSQIT